MLEQKNLYKKFYKILFLHPDKIVNQLQGEI